MYCYKQLIPSKMYCCGVTLPVYIFVASIYYVTEQSIGNLKFIILSVQKYDFRIVIIWMSTQFPYNYH